MEMDMVTATATAADAPALPMSSNRTARKAIVSSTNIVLQMLSSDDEGGELGGEDDDDAATTMGSPVPAAQTLEPSQESLSQELLPTGGVDHGVWVQRRAVDTTAQPAPSRPKRIDEPPSVRDVGLQRRPPSRPKRIDDLFSVSASVGLCSDGSEELKEEAPADPHPASEAPSPQLLLSPASQLHVLSQISEMAESRAARERQAIAAATCPSQPTEMPRPRHAWAPIAQYTQTQSEEPSQTKKNPPKRKLPATKVRSSGKRVRNGNTTVSAGLLADVATWGAFDERILEGNDADEGSWSFEELSDSDF